MKEDREGSKEVEWMGRARYDPELKLAASEYKSDVGYLIREFEIEDERKRSEMKNKSNQAEEEANGMNRPFLTRLFFKRRVSK
jgi:hypothetical protein